MSQHRIAKRYTKPKHQAGHTNRRWFILLSAVLLLTICALFLFGVFSCGPGGGVVPTPTPAAATPSPVQTAPAVPTPTSLQTASPIPAAQSPAPVPGVGKPTEQSQTRYELAAVLDVNQSRIGMKLRTLYTNVTPDTLYELVFHLHPNAFLTQDSPGSQAEYGQYPKGFQKGQLIVGAVSLNGEPTFYSETDDGLLLSVPFPKELLPGEQADVTIEFVVDVPQVDGRFGHTQIGYQLGNFLPILAVYQDGGWVRDGYTTLGDPFYSETADYAVSFKYPQGYTFACTGAILSEQAEGSMMKATATAGDARDFACMVLASGVRSASVQSGSMRILSHALSDTNAQRGAQIAQQALEFCNLYLGEYPYETLSVVQAELGGMGMEYPGLIMIQRELFLPGRENELAVTIAHEVAHQWFYGIVGSDQINAPWLDESLCSYLGACYLEHIGATGTFDGLVQGYLTDGVANGGKIDGTAHEYASDYAYSMSVYSRGAAMWHTLRQELGDGQFYEALSRYVEQNAFRIAVKEDLISAFEDVSGRDLDAFFDEWLAGLAVVPNAA